jgi:hypothetical protein
MLIEVAVQEMMDANQHVSKKDAAGGLKQVQSQWSFPESHTGNSIQQKPDTEIGDQTINGGEIISTEITHAI